MAGNGTPLNAVIDTNVTAYYLLGTEPQLEACRRVFQRVHRAQAPSIWEAELANVLWMAVRRGVLESTAALQRLRLARRLGIESVPVGDLCQGALVRSLESGVAVYDSLFAELAVRARVPLLTFDRVLLRAFPEVARHPEQLV
jgi:predicted nucleic acid-binding protein